MTAKRNRRWFDPPAALAAKRNFVRLVADLPLLASLVRRSGGRAISESGWLRRCSRRSTRKRVGFLVAALRRLESGVDRDVDRPRLVTVSSSSGRRTPTLDR